MHYIIIDLEWNQPLSHMSSAFRRVGDRLMFEMIQIGAVKLDERRRLVGSFSTLITPEFYMKLHPRIHRITGISQDDLADAPRFGEALERFITWCGDDFVLLTWGSDDVSVFQQNLDFFKAKSPLPPFYDLQQLYGTLHEEGKLHKGLQAALSYYGIMPTQEHPFHSAVDDAYYTALVFQRFTQAEDVVKFPQKPKLLGRAKLERREKTLDIPIRNEKTYLASAAAMAVACPVCGKIGRVKEGYVPVRKVFTALADCSDHGLMFVELRFVADTEGKVFARRTVSLSDEQSSAYVQTKHLQWAQKLALLEEAVSQ